MTPADAFLQFGALRCWTGGPPVSGIGFTLGHGSWPIFDGRDATGRRAISRNNVFIDQPARWTGVASWAPRKLTGFWPIDFFRGIAEANKEIAIPWNDGWKMVGGTQPQSADNGIIIVDGDVRWEIQGMRWDGTRWKVDGCCRITAGTVVQGSQGPWSKMDGLMRPSWLSGPWPGPVRLVGWNPQFGKGATAVPGARVEHPDANQREAWVRAILPTGNDPRMIPCGQVFKLRIADEQIEAWLDAERVPSMSQLRVSKRWFAINLRNHGMRLSETGTSEPILESSGGANPVEMAAWRDRGITDEATANNLGRRLFEFGELVAA